MPLVCDGWCGDEGELDGPAPGHPARSPSFLRRCPHRWKGCHAAQHGLLPSSRRGLLRMMACRSGPAFQPASSALLIVVESNHRLQFWRLPCCHNTYDHCAPHACPGPRHLFVYGIASTRPWHHSVWLFRTCRDLGVSIDVAGHKKATYMGMWWRGFLIFSTLQEGKINPTSFRCRIVGCWRCLSR